MSVGNLIAARLLNAGILLVVTVAVVALGWLLSMGLYEIGVWPLAALIRVGCWLFALVGVYWILRHLLWGSDIERLSRRLAKQQED